MMGCLVERGLCVEKIGDSDTMFAAQDRKAAGITAPPDGLYFIQAYYPEAFDLPQPPLGPQWLNLPE